MKIEKNKPKVTVWTFRPTEQQIEAIEKMKDRKSDIIRTALNNLLKLKRG